MKKYLFRIVLIAAFLGLAGYLLWPTYMDSVHQGKLESLSDADSTKYFDENEESIRNSRESRLKLGLDLQGGMYVTMEVDIVELLAKLAKNEDDNLRAILDEARTDAATSDETVLDIIGRKFDEKGMRLSRYYGDIRNSNSEVMTYLNDESEKAVERALEIIRNRIDQYGVSEVTITRSGSRRIILELPGVSDEREVRQLIQETAQLEFKLFAEENSMLKAFSNIDKALLGKPVEDEADTSAIAGDTTATTDGSIAAADSAANTADSVAQASMTDEQKFDEWKKKNPFMALFTATEYGLYATPEQRERINNILDRSDVRNAIPDDVSFAWSAKPTFTNEGQDFYEFYILKRKPELTGEVVTGARAQTDQAGFGGAVVSMQMDAEGAREWARVTGANVNKRIAIVLDNAVFSAPNVKQKIIGGNSQIEGMENMDEARLLEIVLKAGALPAPVEIIEERTVGPSLGEDSIRKGLNSFLIGFGIVIFFMVLYYQYGGVPADIALLFNVGFILAILAGFHGTLTLPGIAGILLTVGMAVDANVLINERIREEYGAGKTMRAAIDAGYSRAFPAIIDSNLTTLLTTIILYQFGSGPIQGFALTLMIGILCSLFTAIVMTRVIFEITLDKAPSIVKFG
ncbi:MAG: protein translocase subunit SecD [Bacteroidetes bacterium]|nr:protein translocase subunit SecD [Bacteroidota bacterium]